MFDKTLMNVVNEGDKITNVSKTKVNAVPDSGFQLMKKEKDTKIIVVPAGSEVESQVFSQYGSVIIRLIEKKNKRRYGTYFPYGSEFETIYVFERRKIEIVSINGGGSRCIVEYREIGSPEEVEVDYNVGFFKKFGYTYREAGVDWSVARGYGN